VSNYNTNEMIEFLKLKWKGKPCPLCDVGQWGVAEDIFELRKYAEGSLIVGNVPVIPIIPVTCNYCGNTVLVSAIVSKVLKPSIPEK
jgi:hypothetical protein